MIHIYFKVLVVSRHYVVILPPGMAKKKCSKWSVHNQYAMMPAFAPNAGQASNYVPAGPWLVKSTAGEVTSIGSSEYFDISADWAGWAKPFSLSPK